ncbi:MAG TPA: hypothetical protein PLG94_13670 [Smithellaceae bacterium]|jgi:spore photoproduct lyase|nr:hypothetical protein [Smithellaceae bacterium]
MNITNNWKPVEIIIHKQIKDDPATLFFLNQCPGVPVKYVDSGKSTDVTNASEILRNSGSGILDKVVAGKQVVFIAPAGQSVNQFTMPDSRMLCPHFDKLNLAPNGCFYQCCWRRSRRAKNGGSVPWRFVIKAQLFTAAIYFKEQISAVPV